VVRQIKPADIETDSDTAIHHRLHMLSSGNFKDMETVENPKYGDFN
jgi:hypothetical protein